MFSTKFILILIISLILFILTRTIYLIIKINKKEKSLKHISLQKKSLKTLIILGSGGHSTEMLRLVKELNTKIFTPKIYVVASSDNKSKEKVLEFEKSLKTKSKYKIYEIPRSRKVHQSYITSIFTTLYSIFYCIPLMFSIKPDLILCNGPGTCIPICLLSFLLKVMFISRNSVIVFVESICRVKSLSLSGMILYYIADIFLVQWTDLLSKYKRAEYIGRF